MNGRAVIAM